MKLKLESILQQSLDLETNVGPACRRERGTLRRRAGGRVNIVLRSVRPPGPSLNLKTPNVVSGFDQVFERGIDYVEPPPRSADHCPIRAVRIRRFHRCNIEFQGAGWLLSVNWRKMKCADGKRQYHSGESCGTQKQSPA